MSKFIIVLIALCLVFAGCGNDEAKYRDKRPELIDNTWFFEDIPKNIDLPEVGEKLQDAVLKLPRAYSEELDGILFYFDFGKTEYHIGELIKCRMIMTNNTDDILDFEWNATSKGYFARDDGERLYFTSDNNAYINESVENFEMKPGESFVLDRGYIADPIFFATEGTYWFEFYFDNDRDGIYPLDHQYKIKIDAVIQKNY